MGIETTIERQKATAVGPLPAGHPTVRKGRIGVLLTNLGTPDATDYRSVRRYLSEFLSDARVIEIPKWKWYPILFGIILNTRPQKTGANYEKIWNREKDESPLRTITRGQADKLAAAFGDEPSIVVEWGMRYGNPSIESALERLTAQGCDRVLCVPLYPQYSATTTATANDQFYRALMKMRFMPAVRTLPPYHDEPAYIEALARSVETHLAGLDFEPEVVLASYHGIPISYFEKGDPYHCHCQKTTRLLRERLGWDDKRLITTFQSLFGREEWIKPYTDATVQRLATEGVRKIAIINPGFSADCIETLEEIDGEVREIFMHAGGERFSHIPCLNDGDDSIAMIEHLVRRQLGGWL
ncbi:ferrochelatase [Mesorhizobium sp. CAU 1741]|uniref:ferrochelatase n=1 Tax=Mesorhizobium sp. CAU 1741 TaxID=3140366 RepID=UPI00325B88D3